MRGGELVLGSLGEKLESALVVGFHAQPALIAEPEIVLAAGVSLLRRIAEDLSRLFVIALDDRTVEVEMSERELRVEIARIGGLLYQLERAMLVVLDAVAADIAYAEREYAGDITELGALCIVGCGARKIDCYAVARKIFFAYIEVFFAEEIGRRERFVFIVVSHYFTLCEVYCLMIIPRAQTIIKLLTAELRYSSRGSIAL